MAITDAQKVDLLYKKIGFGVAKTDTSAFKSPSNEANASPLLTRGDTIWVESGLIPGVKPASNSSVLVLYQQSLSSAVECTLDTTVSGTNRTWLTNYNDWISAEFGPSYQVKVYAAPAGNASPETYGTQLFADGSGNADAWYFDYQSGILNFPDTNVPSSVTGKKIYVIGARYVGLKGVGTLANLNIGNLSVDSFTTNSAAILGGYLSNIANITAVTANLQSLYSNILNITSANVGTGYVGNLSSGNAVITGGYISSLSNISVTTGNAAVFYITELNSTTSNVTNAYINNLSVSNVLIASGQLSNVDAQINNLSSGNVLLSGGVVYNTNIQANNFSSANVLVTGGIIYNVDLQANNFSTANALLTGGDIFNVNAQVNNFSSGNVLVNGGIIYNVDLQANNFSTANALIVGGILYNIDIQANNFSTGNALINGGAISNVNAQVNNFSSGNVFIAGGIISNINLQANNFSTGNALVTGGVVYNIDLQANNLSTGNALIDGGDISNVNAQVNNFSTANALVSGGVIYNINLQANNLSTGNILASAGIIYNVDVQANNISAANALITSGNISNVSAQINNLSSGNVLLSGGILYNVDVQANNFSTANAFITSGNITANLNGNLTGSFSSFTGNVSANWFIGNLDATKANFADLVFVNSNLTISGNTIASGNVISRKITSPTGDLHISAGTESANNLVIFDSVSAFSIPSGTTAQRPPSPLEGYVRFNTDLGSIEWWTGLSWTSSNQNVNYQTIVPDGSSNAYTLDYESSDAGILVSINGTTQQPGSAYSVSGGTTITFSEVPLTTDIIEIRFLSAGLVAANYIGGNVSGNVNILANTVSTSTASGALTVAGGTGIIGNIHVGGNINVATTTGTPSNTGSPASWLKIYVGGTEYFLPLYQ